MWCTSKCESECVSHLVVSNSWDPMDCSPPGSSVHGILQARILEWVPFSRESSRHKDRTLVSRVAGRFTDSLPSEPPGKLLGEDENVLKLDYSDSSLHNTVNIWKNIELFTLTGQIIWYANYISIKLLRKRLKAV